MKISDVLRRVTLLFFVVCALMATLSGIANIPISDLLNETRELVSSQTTKVKDDYLSLAEKTSQQQMNHVNGRVSDSSTEDKTLEESVKMERYPTEKVIATGYTAGAESTGKTPDHPEYGITYSGVKVTRDLYSTIAADLSVFPIGTILYIPDYGYGVVADKGGLIKGNRIDLFYDHVDDVYEEWGKKELDVHVVEMGEGHLTEEMLNQLNENEALQVFREQIDNK